MNAAPVLIGYAATVGVLAPRVLVRCTWPHRAPALAVATWHALTVSFTVAVALAAYNLATPTHHLHAGIHGLLYSCELASESSDHAPHIADSWSLAPPVSVVLLVCVSFIIEALRARRARSRHLRILDVVGRPSTALRAVVLDHDVPAAYCLPGRHSRVVVSQGALRLLSTEQLAAVLEHERAHITGRHHLVLAAAQAFAAVFGWVPLARHAKEQTAMLLEMVADDRALRHHSRDVLATAMYEMAAAKAAPRGSFAAGGPSALPRLQRVLAPQRPPHPALAASVTALAVAVPLLPFLVGCTHGAG
ncbi:M56 family metallopeptidase [Actinacidiphila glaucinigra]|uniref:M56 family metallopeptidase n=1 Tax=Actinacidiphila glaucinigra TaxID=235986 RepID=UPI003719772F